MWTPTITVGLSRPIAIEGVMDVIDLSLKARKDFILKNSSKHSSSSSSSKKFNLEDKWIKYVEKLLNID